MEDTNRVIAGHEQEQDGWQYSLRPRRLAEYIGQSKVCLLYTSDAADDMQV